MKPRRAKGLVWPDAWYCVGLEATRTVTKPHISWKANAWQPATHLKLLLIVGLQSLMIHLQHIQVMHPRCNACPTSGISASGSAETPFEIGNYLRQCFR